MNEDSLERMIAWHIGSIGLMLYYIGVQGGATLCRGFRRAERLTRHKTLFYA